VVASSGASAAGALADPAMHAASTNQRTHAILFIL
jgi:hypothetical protein